MSALVMREINLLLIAEMDREELSLFRDNWIDVYADAEARETGYPPDLEVAEIRFEDYMGQEGYTERDERIAERRDKLVGFPENPAWKAHRVVVDDADDSLGELVVVEGLNLPEERRWGLFTPGGEFVRHCRRDVR